MSKVPGKNTYVSVSTADISDHVTSVSFGLTAETFEVSGMGSDDMEYIGGREGGTVQLSGSYDTSTTSGPRYAVKPYLHQSVAVVYRPEGTGSGLPEDQFSAIIASYDETSAVGDAKKWASTLTITGAVTSTSQ